MSDELRIGLTTLDDERAAERLARAVVERGLAVCVQIEPSIRSVYRWEGEVQDQSEVRLMIKFPARQAEALAAYIHANHGYDVPEWIVIRPEFVSPKYLDWATA